MKRSENSQPDVIIRPMVLVVDDEPSVCEALSLLLSPRLEPAYRVETAESAEEALDLVQSSGNGGETAPVALVISDERMPGKTGTELLIALRQHPAHRDGGRIIVTAYAGLASAKKAINEAEVDRYFPKPWDAEGSLLPAIGDILTRFASKRELDRYLQVSLVSDPEDLAAVREVRRAWWEYLMFLGEPPEEGGSDIPSFEEPEDEGADLFLARRLSPRENQPAGTIRLRADEETGTRILDGLAFLPEEAGDRLEALLLHAAVIHAAFADVKSVRTQVPALRQEIYTALGFGDMTPEPGDSRPGTRWMRMKASELKVAPAFLGRYRSDGNLCSCAQTACPANDFAGERRGYYCPQDLKEGRAPTGFPSGSTG